MRGVGLGKSHLTPCADGVGGAEMHGGWGVQADPGVAVLVVVRSEELLAERAGVLQRTEPFGEVRAVLERLELRLAVRVVVGYPGAGVGALHVEAGEQFGDGPRRHGGIAVGVYRQGCGAVAVDGVRDECFGEVGGFVGRAQPAGDVAGVDVQEHVELKPDALGWAARLVMSQDQICEGPLAISSGFLRGGWVP